MTVIAFLLISSCASGPQKIDFPPDTDPQAKLSELRDRMKNDQTAQVDYLSPSHFKQAEKSLNQAQESLDRNQPAEDVLSDAGKAQAWLQLAEETASSRSTELEPVLNSRKAALSANAQNEMPKELASANDEFRDLGRNLEKPSFHPEAKMISTLEARYSGIELNSVKKSALGESRAILERAAENDGKKKAPLTYNAAQVRYDSALRSVEANRRNPSGYQEAVNDSLQSARKLEHVLRTIGSSKTSEAAAVKIYDQQQELATTRQSLDASQAQTQSARNQVARERQEVAALQGQNEAYADKETNNQRIEAAKAKFSPSEAEVFRDGSKIILRLKSMRFSTARFELTQSSLTTLQKVKDMIAAVPVSKVTVEGHTDNIGGEKKNLALSQNRAETVKKYLVAENAVPEEKIEAQGLGYEKPLTSNKTAQGRAINRRVDVVIDTDANL